MKRLKITNIYKRLIERIKALRQYFVRCNYSLDDMKWAFEQGIHEGKLREHYKNNGDDFNKSELEYYLKSMK
jgi:hypothetical protein